MAIRIPFAYQEVEYIESTGTQYINTGYKAASEKLKIVCEYTVISSNTGASLFGSESSASPKYSLVPWGNHPSMAFYVGASAELLSMTALTGAKNTLVAEANGGTLTVTLNGSVRNATYDSTLQKTYPIAIFGNNINGTVSQLSSYRLHSMQIYDNDVLKRDFVPCYRKADSVVGLYDTINDTLFVNNGSGTFAIGAEINRVDRKFQSGVVGKTNVVEGMVIDDPLVQLVNYTMLYDEGDQCADITGGWEFTYAYSDGSATFGDSYMTIVSKNITALSKITTKNKINMNEYVAMFGRAKSLGAYSTASDHNGAFRTTNTTGRAGFTTDGLTEVTYYNSADESCHTWDLTTMTGEHYACMSGWNTNEARGYNCAVFKEDDIDTLCEKAGLSTFASVSALIADTGAISAILSNQSAVRYMTKNCTGSLMAWFITNSNCLSLLESSPYKTTIQANPHWAKFLAMVA